MRIQSTTRRLNKYITQYRAHFFCCFHQPLARLHSEGLTLAKFDPAASGSPPLLPLSTSSGVAPAAQEALLVSDCSSEEEASAGDSDYDPTTRFRGRGLPLVRRRQDHVFPNTRVRGHGINVRTRTPARKIPVKIWPWLPERASCRGIWRIRRRTGVRNFFTDKGGVVGSGWQC